MGVMRDASRANRVEHRADCTSRRALSEQLAQVGDDVIGAGAFEGFSAEAEGAGIAGEEGGAKAGPGGGLDVIADVIAEVEDGSGGDAAV